MDKMYIVWAAAIVVFGVLEGMTAQLVSIWFVLGAIAALVAALCGATLPVQIIIFVAVTIITLIATRPIVKKKINFKAEKTNADRCIGESAVVTEEINNLEAKGLVKADGKAVFYAENPVNAKAGDTVTFTRTENGGIIGVLLAFGVPLLLIAVTLVINYLFVKKEIFALITSGCSVIAWYAVLSAIDKKIRKAGRLGGRIISVTAKGNAEDKTE